MDSSDLTRDPGCLDQWFPLEQQHRYVSLVLGNIGKRVGLTRYRTEYFVRLWAYLWLKQQLSLGKKIIPPIKELGMPEGFVSCTHREAAEVFYAHRERGGERSAGMMLDKLVNIGLLEKQFDGNTICLRILPLIVYTPPPIEIALKFKVDAFDPKADAIPIASLFVNSDNWHPIKVNSAVAIPRIVRSLRTWSKQYPLGMRVLRRCDNSNPVGFYLFYPTASESEANFFLTPRKSMYLGTSEKEDPVKMAIPGCENCTSIFARNWFIEKRYMKKPQVIQLLEDGQETIKCMREDFPYLSDLYTLILSPYLEALAKALGCQKITEDVTLDAYWMYLPIDRFLALDIQQIISKLKF